MPAWGFLDTNQEEFAWQLLKPSPLFVNLYDTEYVYKWDTANTFEGQDGSIWFTSVNGVIRYDMESEAACWISPESGPIAETTDGSLWILLKEQLYKYDPE
jgi:ligand-binding sensor domain-containing protein